MPDSKQEILDFFRDQACRYDRGVWAYRLMGIDEGRFRRETVRALALARGDTVIDLACGTGLNFPLLQKAVGASGKIIGVDLSPEMLGRARRRVETAGWRNVELVEADLNAYDFPAGTAGMLSTFSMYLVPDPEDVIRRGAAALRPGGRLAILDAKYPDRPPAWTAVFPRWREQPFGIDPKFLAQRPMEYIRRHMKEILFQEYYFGYLYLSVGRTKKTDS
ncbi:MAG: class I SAM-dependent methyltransferase [Anaerolineales bacterium]|nr:class I SAM-dependent methyltransferase [Anaerolineales bacterium]